jgi:hypothetical protein
MNIYTPGMVKHLKRACTIVRVFRPHIPDNPMITQIFDEDEGDAMREYIERCILANLTYNTESLIPH